MGKTKNPVFAALNSIIKGKQAKPAEIASLNRQVVIKYLSASKETLPIALALDRYDLTNKALYYAARDMAFGKVSFIKFPKVQPEEARKLEAIAAYFNINLERAQEYLEFLSPEELQEILQAEERK